MPLVVQVVMLILRNAENKEILVQTAQALP